MTCGASPSRVTDRHAARRAHRPHGDHLIGAAVTGQADLIASGDKRDLLPMGSFHAAIVTAREAVERLDAIGKT